MALTGGPRAPMAPLIAIVGCDGSGKSTLALDLCEEIGRTRRNGLYLPQVELAANIRATGDLAELAACSIALAVTPFTAPGVPILLAAAGALLAGLVREQPA